MVKLPLARLKESSPSLLAPHPKPLMVESCTPTSSSQFLRVLFNGFCLVCYFWGEELVGVVREAFCVPLSCLICFVERNGVEGCREMDQAWWSGAVYLSLHVIKDKHLSVYRVVLAIVP